MAPLPREKVYWTDAFADHFGAFTNRLSVVISVLVPTSVYSASRYPRPPWITRSATGWASISTSTPRTSALPALSVTMIRLPSGVWV